jgi:hypothetical protein
VLNSMFGSGTVVGRDGNTSPGIPADEVLQLMGTHGRPA